MNKYVYGALAALAILGAVAFTSYTKGYGDARVASMEEYGRELEQARSEAFEASENLRKQNTTALRAKQNEINKLASSVKSLRNELLSRPSRSDPLPPGAGQTCTGRELYREDGEFLIGEASAAERVRIERDYYYERYEEARQQLERLKNGKDWTEQPFLWLQYQYD